MPETGSTPYSQSIFPFVEDGDLDAIRSILDRDPMLVHARQTSSRPRMNFTETDPDLNFTPLQLAAQCGELAVCKLLVERGAEVYTNPFSTYPPVIQAAWNDHQHVVDYFLNEIPDRADGTNGLGVAINLAAREGWAEIVEKHLQADPLSVHQRGWIGDTPLHWPSHNNFTEIVAMLLDAGADVEADEINCYGGKPLHWASEHAPAAVELLLSRGADVNSRNVKVGSGLEGMTPLIMNATQHNDCSEVTELLLAAGADTRARDVHGKTALDYAQEKGLRRIAGVLQSSSTRA